MPRPVGRPRRETPAEAPELLELREAKSELEEELEAMRVRVQLAAAFPNWPRKRKKRGGAAARREERTLRALPKRLQRRRSGRLLSQADERAAERGARKSAVAFTLWRCRRGGRVVDAARQLALAAETLGRWVREHARHDKKRSDRGRPAKRLPAAMRDEVLVELKEQPTSTVAALGESFPEAGRNELAELAQCQRELAWREYRQSLANLEWLRVGAVWAIDGTWLETPVESGGRRALIVVDVGAPAAISFRQVTGESAHETIASLEGLLVHREPAQRQLHLRARRLVSDATDARVLPHRFCYQGRSETEATW